MKLAWAIACTVFIAHIVVAAERAPSSQPPDVSCLDEGAVGYLNELLARIRDLEQKLDAETQARMAERQEWGRVLERVRRENAERVEALAERDRAPSPRIGHDVAAITAEPGFEPPTANPQPSGADRVRALRSERAAREADPAGKLRPGDAVTIRVTDVPELNRTFTVDARGDMDLPLVGRVRAAERNPGQLVEELTRKLSKFVKKPRVDVVSSPTVSGRVTISGAVAHPGRYPLGSATATIPDVIASAGGTTPRASGIVRLTPSAREGEAGQPITLRLSDLGPGGAAVDIPLAPGDHIDVPEPR